MYSLIPQTLIKSIGWTLIHSLWQGLLITLIAGVLILVTRRSRPALRYNLLTALFFGFLLTCLITFIMQWRENTPASTEIDASISTQSLPLVVIPIADTTTDPSVLSVEGFRQYFNMHATVFVIGWFLIFLFKTVRLGSNLNYVRLMRRHNWSVESRWQERVSQMATHIGIRRAVSLVESATVKVPVVIGMLKPVILLPFGVLANLPVDQVEAILLHELAHIRRKDYLVNMFQCAAEAVFFFNPALLWLSSQIREERENCCDDVALGIIHNKPAYIHALMAFQENKNWRSGDTATVTPAFPGKKHHLLNRVKRIVYNNNKNLNSMEKFFLAGGLVVVGIVALAFTTDKPATTAIKPETAIGQKSIIENAYLNTPPADTPRTNSTIVTSVDGKEYKIVMKNDVVSELYVDGKRIPDENMGDYKTTTDKIIIETKVQAIKAREEADKTRREAAVARSQAAESRKAEQMARQEDLKAKREADKSKMEERKSKMREEVQEEKREQVEKKEKREKPEKKEKPERIEKKEQQEKIENEEIREKKEMMEKKKDEQLRVEEKRRDQREAIEEIRKDKMKNREERARDRKEGLKDQQREREQMQKERKHRDEEERRMDTEKKQMEKHRELEERKIEEKRKQIDEHRREEEGRIEKERKQRDEEGKRIDEKQKRIAKNPAEPKAAESTMKARENIITTSGKQMTLQSNQLVGKAASNESVKANNGILDDLVSEKVINDWYRQSRINITLNKKELLVNGVRQPDPVHAKIAQKYLPKNGAASVSYSFSRGEQ